MKSLQTLIKLHKKKLDDLVTEINNLEKNKQNFINTLEHLKIEQRLEQEKYSGSEYAFMLDSYLKQSEIDKKRLSDQIKRLELDLQLLQPKLEKQFAELKKFELALEKRVKKEQEKLKVVETKMLDEFNTNKFASKNSFDNT
jgi:flagellar biosynthesis chaperone FliJ